MTALPSLKPDLVAPDIERLGALVLAVEDRLRAPGASRDWDAAQLSWPELMALEASIAEDDGWLLFVRNPGQPWEKLFLYLDAPQIFLHSSHMQVDTQSIWPFTRWTPAPISVVESAKRARRKRLGKETPPYTDDIIRDMRERQWFQWGRP